MLKYNPQEQICSTEFIERLIVGAMDLDISGEEKKSLVMDTIRSVAENKEGSEYLHTSLKNMATFPESLGNLIDLLVLKVKGVEINAENGMSFVMSLNNN